MIMDDDRFTIDKGKYFNCNFCNKEVDYYLNFTAIDPFYGFRICLKCLKKLVKEVEEGITKQEGEDII